MALTFLTDILLQLLPTAPNNHALGQGFQTLSVCGPLFIIKKFQGPPYNTHNKICLDTVLPELTTPLNIHRLAVRVT